MCLINTSKVSSGQHIGWGWKVFYRGKNRHLYSESVFRSKQIVVGKWLNEKLYRPEDSAPGYGYGWHIFCFKAHAEEWRAGGDGFVVRVVKYRYATAVGLLGNRKCVVAKRIFIIPLGRRRGRNVLHAH